MNEREKLAVRAALIGVVTNGFLSGVKILVGFVFNSVAVLADGVDTGTDIFTSFATLISSKVSTKPPDRTHPYGHERVEAIVAKIVSFIIFYAGLSLLISSSRRLVAGQYSNVVGVLPLLVSVLSVAVKAWLFLYKYSVGRKIKSSAFIADALNMRNDILISSTVFLGVLFSKLGLAWVDPLVAILVSIFIIRTAFIIFKETSYELMDGMLDMEIYNSIFDAVKSVNGAVNPHKVRVRQVGYKYYVDLDVEVDESITVREGHEIATAVKKAIIEHNDRVADVMVHVEPRGNVEQEAFGLDEEVLNGGKKNDNLW